MNDPYEIHILETDHVAFSRGPGGVFQGVIDGTVYDELIVYRAFPFVYTSEYISVRNNKDEEIGIIVDTKQLDGDSRDQIDQELQFRYFLPRVERVDSVKQKNDLWVWHLQTNLGATVINMRNLHEHMQFPGEQRIILTDINGKRCEISDWHALDLHSRKQLKDVI